MRFMEQQGFDVTHHGLDRDGDQGIDLRATKGRDLDLVLWAITRVQNSVEKKWSRADPGVKVLGDENKNGHPNQRGRRTAKMREPVQPNPKYSGSGAI